MSAATIQQMADRVAALMQDRLRVRGKTLAEKVRRGGRLLPRDVRAEAQTLARAADQAANPKLLMQIDEARIAQAYDICLRHLQGVDRAARRWEAIMGVASSIAFSLVAVVALVLAVLLWRGFL